VHYVINLNDFMSVLYVDVLCVINIYCCCLNVIVEEIESAVSAVYGSSIGALGDLLNSSHDNPPVQGDQPIFTISKS
jgi:hypothetical protein